MPLYNSGRPLNAASERVCSLSGYSLSCLYWSSVMPATMPDPSDPVATTSISLIYRHAVFGFLQYALCMTVDKESPARARVGAPPDRKECRENSCVSAAACIYFFNAADIFAAEMGRDPLIALPSRPQKISENKYPPVMSHPTPLPISISCVTARTGHTATCSSSYGTISMWSAPSRWVFPYGKLNMSPRLFGSLSMR